MARARTPAPRADASRYARLLESERRSASLWPRHDGRLLAQLEAGLPVAVWGFHVGIPRPYARLDPDGRVTALERHDPALLLDPDGVAPIGLNLTSRRTR